VRVKSRSENGLLLRQIIQLAKHLGIKSINIVRRPEQKEELLALGADEVLCSTTEGKIFYELPSQFVERLIKVVSRLFSVLQNISSTFCRC
jgi:D-arabinose 1-dehydrogenase-like Zn-dependent alcohol dehydrogenase